MTGTPLPVVGAQRSVQWLLDRLGWCTCSRLKDVMAKLKDGKPAKARTDYAWDLVVERLTGNPTERYANAAMSWGTEQEAFARARYEAQTGEVVLETGFLKHPTIAKFGGSPDGLVGHDGGIEIKCPFNSGIHLQTIRDGMPAEHKPQVQGYMAVAGIAWMDFISYDPRMPAPLDIHVQRIERDDAYVVQMLEQVEAFLAEVDSQVNDFRSRK
jgi:hypothetical protein